MRYAAFLQDLGLGRSETRELLKQAGCRNEPLWSGDPAADEVRDEVEVLVTSDHHVDSEVLGAWPGLKMVSLAFTGYNDVDLVFCRRRNLHVYYVPGYATDSVVELTVALTLSVLRRIPYADRRLRAGYWDRGDVKPGGELAGRTVGILGTGTIGLRSAQVFKALGCELIGWSRTRRADFPGEYKELDELFREADVVAVHLPLDGATRAIVSRERIGLMKPGAVLINTSRAGLVDTRALAEALAGQRIGGAGIDVFEPEPPSVTEDPLLCWEARNVVVTPHLGFKTREALDRLARTTIANIGRYLRDDPENRLLPRT
jgi:phosphoglycerate dehydrogenase-like enzyme